MCRFESDLGYHLRTASGRSILETHPCSPIVESALLAVVLLGMARFLVCLGCAALLAACSGTTTISGGDAGTGGGAAGTGGAAGDAGSGGIGGASGGGGAAGDGGGSGGGGAAGDGGSSGGGGAAGDGGSSGGGGAAGHGGAAGNGGAAGDAGAGGSGSNVCPEINSFTATPMVIPIGDDQSLVAVTASDADIGPEPLRTILSATTGTFADREASSTTYTCGAPGAAEITVRATDGDVGCDVEQTITIQCPSDIPLNLCPELFTVNAIPSKIPPGEDSTEVQVRAEDPDDGPLPLVTTFYAFRGTFDDPNAEDTIYNCESSGLQEVCADASDGACVKTLCTSVTCP